MRELVLVVIGVLLAVFVDRYVLGTQKFGQRGDGRPTSRWIQGLLTGNPPSVFHGRPALDEEIAELKGRIEMLRVESDAWRASTRAAAPPPEVSPRPCPSCGCGSPSHTVDCEQADAA